MLPPQLSFSWNWIPSPLTFSRFYSPKYLLFHLNDQSFPFLWDDSLQFTNTLGSPLFRKVLCWFPHPSLITSHFSTSLHNLLPQNSYLHNLHCFHLNYSSNYQIVSLLLSFHQNVSCQGPQLFSCCQIVSLCSWPYSVSLLH